MAYIGQAANVMRTRGISTARTAHSWLYELREVPVLDSDGKPVIDEVFNKPKTRMEFVPRDLSGIEYVIVDESYTFPLRMKKDLLNLGSTYNSYRRCESVTSCYGQSCFLSRWES